MYIYTREGYRSKQMLEKRVLLKQQNNREVQMLIWRTSALFIIKSHYTTRVQQLCAHRPR